MKLKNKYPIPIIKLILIWGILLQSCAVKTQTEENQTSIQGKKNSTIINLEYKIIESGTNGGMREPGKFLVNTEVMYNNFFDIIYKDRVPEEYPKAEEKNKTYIFIFFGRKSNGGFYTPSKILKNEITQTVEVYLKYNRTDFHTATAISESYIVIEIPKTEYNKLLIKYN